MYIFLPLDGCTNFLLDLFKNHPKTNHTIFVILFFKGVFFLNQRRENGVGTAPNKKRMVDGIEQCGLIMANENSFMENQKRMLIENLRNS